MEDIISIFTQLKRPTQGDLQSFATFSPKNSHVKFGKDTSGWPVLLIKTSDPSLLGPSIHLEHLDIQHSVNCRITIENNIEEGIFTVIRCINANEDLIKYFFYVIDPILKTLSPSPTPKEIADAVSHLVELFRSLSQPPTKAVNGLWAELFIIRISKDPIVLLKSWHSTPEEKYDFSSDIQRLEVKSSSYRSRVHHFSLEQLNPPSGCQVAIASIFVDRNGGGKSLGELIQEIKNLLSVVPELEQKLDRVIAQTLGSSFHASMGSRFDSQLARDSLRIFSAETVPKISEPLPLGISEVHFKADLGQCKNLSRQELSSTGGIFASL